MNWHPTDDDLILKFYGEHSATEAARIDVHLRGCSTCQAAWTDISETLKLVDTATVPDPPDGFERVMWAKVLQVLPAPRRSLWTWRQLVPVASLAAIIVAAVALGLRSRDAGPVLGTPSQPQLQTTTRTPDASQARERVLLTALDGHFEQTELLLLELLNAPDRNGQDLEFERTTAGDLVASGRLYRMTAEQIGKRHLAAMLDEFEPLLVEVARSPERVNRKDIRSLRSQIDGEGLLFKVRALTNEIRERQQEITTHEGGL